MGQLGGFRRTVAITREDGPTLRASNRDVRFPDDLAHLVFWSGNELRVKKDKIITERENSARSELAVTMAKFVRAFPRGLVVTGHHGDIYKMPDDFDEHISDLRVVPDKVGVPTTDLRKLAEGVRRRTEDRRDKWHCPCTSEGQWVMAVGVSEACVLAALQLPIRHAVAINRLPGIRIPQDRPCIRSGVAA